MNKNKSLANTKIFCEGENFYFNRLTGKPYCEFRKLLGRLLFKIRQDNLKSLQTVSQAVKIPDHVVDSVEIGSNGLHWDAIAKLLDYYQKRVKLYVVEKYTTEEKEEMREKKSNLQQIEDAKAIIEKTKQCDKLAREIAKVSEVVVQSCATEEKTA